MASPFALRKRMTDHTSHLVGLWIGAAISDTSHSNKASSTTVKRARLKVKDQGRRQYCHNKHKSFLYRPYEKYNFRTRLVKGQFASSRKNKRDIFL